ncbi:hypothetical protein H7J71_20450 [Mycolicibacterium peregrinum]|nr:hypothetical protein [Mycolicibacterium peregrinum]
MKDPSPAMLYIQEYVAGESRQEGQLLLGTATFDAQLADPRPHFASSSLPCRDTLGVAFAGARRRTF